jgi:hypothetical protein
MKMAPNVLTGIVLMKPVGKYVLIATLVLFCLSIASQARPEEGKVLFREDFNDLARWKPRSFANIKKQSSYTIESNGHESWLKAESNASASAILYRGEFNIYQYSRMRWRWKVENICKNGNAKTKSGDDYPLRIHVLFKYDPERAGFLEKLTYRTAKLIHGEYPPHSSLDYIWANRDHEEKILPNVHTGKSKMVLVQKGDANCGKWLTHDMNISRWGGASRRPLAAHDGQDVATAPEGVY